MNRFNRYSNFPRSDEGMDCRCMVRLVVYHIIVDCEGLQCEWRRMIATTKQRDSRGTRVFAND